MTQTVFAMAALAMLAAALGALRPAAASGEITWSFPYNRPETLNPAGVSGKTGRATTLGQRTAGLPPDQIMVFYLEKPVGITIGERSDEPCYLNWRTEGDYHSSSPLHSLQDHTYTHQACGGEPRYKRINFSRANAVMALRVCTNGRPGLRGELVKGVQVQLGRRETPDGPLVVHTTVEMKQPNCENWSSTWSRCTNDMAGAALTVHDKPLGNKRVVVGLQLQCWPTGPLNPARR